MTSYNKLGRFNEKSLKLTLHFHKSCCSLLLTDSQINIEGSSSNFHWAYEPVSIMRFLVERVTTSSLGKFSSVAVYRFYNLATQ